MQYLYLNLFATAFTTFAAIFTAGYIPKWFTALLWICVVLNVVCFFINALG